MIKILSFNVHGAMDEESKEIEPWEIRKKPISTIIRFCQIDLLGLQEPFLHHIEDLQELLPEYIWIGKGLEDGEKQGPFNAIFFKKELFEVLDFGFFYLSNTPDRPSKGFGAYFPRGVSWAKLKIKQTNKVFYFFNTHFDYHSQNARNESSKMIRKKIEEIAKDTPFILVGDFNLFSELGGEETYEILTKKNHKTYLFDAMEVALHGHKGPLGSWSGFTEPGKEGVKPDYIFVSKKGIKVLTHRIIGDTFKGHYPSDHLPVMAEVEIGF